MTGVAAEFDVVIVGGGLAGASLACALAQLPLRIALLDALVAPDSSPAHAVFDQRAIVLNYASARMYQNLALWPNLQRHSTPIKQIHVSDQGHFGMMRFYAKDYDLPALGYVIPAKQLGSVLYAQFSSYPNLTLYQEARVLACHTSSDHAEIMVSKNDVQYTMKASLVIATDGSDSAVRDQLGIQVTIKDYAETAIVAVVQSEQAHDHRAFERFCGHGPIALLPLSDHHFGLVWVAPQAQAQTMMTWSDRQFLHQLQNEFGYRVGYFCAIGPRSHYPLRMLHAEQLTTTRAVLLGNAAQTIHPIAGQGLNLGLRAVAVLAETLTRAINEGKEVGDPAVLSDYAQSFKHHQQRVMQYTDTIVHTFRSQNPLVSLLRNLSLNVCHGLPIKHSFAAEMMGLAGEVPVLMRKASYTLPPSPSGRGMG